MSHKPGVKEAFLIFPEFSSSDLPIARSELQGDQRGAKWAGGGAADKEK